MALRMNLYGCQISAIHEAVGSKSDTLLEAASAQVADTLNEESARAKAIAWLETLIQTGHPLNSARPHPSVPEDGSLLVSHVETEIHVCALHCLIQGIQRDDWLDLSGQSSHWHHSAISALYNDLAACGFTKSTECPMELFRCLESLNHGTPLFGDDFRTDWSYYSLLPTNEVVGFIQALKVAVEFKRSIPDFIPEHLRETMVISLTDEAREFVTELSGWLRQIADSGQDAYILWW